MWHVELVYWCTYVLEREQSLIMCHYVHHVTRVIKCSLSCCTYTHDWEKKKRNMEPVRLQPPTCLPLLLLERTRVNTVFLHRGDTSIEREVRVKIRKFRLIATIVLSLFFFFSLDSYALYVYARLKRKKKKLER